MKTPSNESSKRHNRFNRGIYGKRRKGFMLIFSLLMGKSSSYEPRLVFFHAFVYYMLDVIDPF
jgi:hypothetical protein